MEENSTLTVPAKVVIDHRPPLIRVPELENELQELCVVDCDQGSYRFSRIKFKDFSRTFPGLLKSFSSTFMHR